MAKIVDHILYQERLHQYVVEANLDYGRKTARRWIVEIEKIRKFVKVFPEGKPPFDGVPDFPYQLRGANFMNNFKLIYYYLEERDEVHFLDIWDMRKNPSSFWSIDEENEKERTKRMLEKYVGCWQGDETAEEIIRNIYESRRSRSEPLKFDD